MRCCDSSSRCSSRATTTTSTADFPAREGTSSRYIPSTATRSCGSSVRRRRAEIVVLDPLTGEVIEERGELMVFPATHYVASRDRIEKALIAIEEELDERLVWYRKKGPRARGSSASSSGRGTTRDDPPRSATARASRTYSRHFDGRAPGQPRIRCSTGSLRISCSSSDDIASDDSAGAGHVRGRPVAQGETSSTTGSRLPSAFDKPAADFPRSLRSD